jgi:asparagine synthase (glutamine-hydrolysing)
MVKEMCTIMKHGGPDDEGLYTNKEHQLVLGHRRLSLLDLSEKGHQPMKYENGRYIISYNGEIYNFKSLKKELQGLGHHFNTTTDTEVILAGFAEWNTLSFSKLSGMFAFALYDTVEKELFLVKDPSGIKPLYYTVTDHSVEFASEMRAFSVIGNKEDNDNWRVYQMAYGFIPEPITTLKQVKPLHKGCFLKYNLINGTYNLQSFTHYSYSNTTKDVSESHDLIRRSIEQAVESHLLADAPVGVFLSGGIDSTIVTGAAAGKHAGLKTLSLYFNEMEFSEKKYQDQVIKQLQCNNYQHLLSEKEFHESLPEVLAAMDMPSCDGINTWFISKYANQHGLKAVLSGIGGDELFGGYPSFSRIGIAQQLQHTPKMLAEVIKHSSHRINRLPYLKMGNNGLYLFLRGLFPPVKIAEYLDANEKEIIYLLRDCPVIPEMARVHKKNKAGWLELNVYMQNQLLRDADVMSMAHGVEIRVPFLDPQVIKTAFSIEPKIKYSGKIAKQILVDSFKGILPESIWDRKKMGFGFPYAKWMRSSSFVADTMHHGSLRSRHGYKEFKAGKLHWSHFLALMHVQLRSASS